MDMVRAGKTESELMPLYESISVMKLPDRVRDIPGLRYPMEEMS